MRIVQKVHETGFLHRDLEGMQSEVSADVFFLSWRQFCFYVPLKIWQEIAFSIAVLLYDVFFESLAKALKGF